jgi:hypothetical protein
VRSIVTMLRVGEVSPGGLIYQVLNRSVAGRPLFRKGQDLTIGR